MLTRTAVWRVLACIIACTSVGAAGGASSTAASLVTMMASQARIRPPACTTSTYSEGNRILTEEICEYTEALPGPDTANLASDAAGTAAHIVAISETGAAPPTTTVANHCPKSQARCRGKCVAKETVCNGSCPPGMGKCFGGERCCSSCCLLSGIGRNAYRCGGDERYPLAVYRPNSGYQVWCCATDVFSESQCCVIGAAGDGSCGHTPSCVAG